MEIFISTLTSQARFTKKRVSTMLFLLAPVALGNGLLHVCVALQVSRADRRLVRASGHGAPITKDLSYWKALGKLVMILYALMGKDFIRFAK